MDDALTLIGFRYSVYTRIVRMALIEMGLTARYVEVDPFSENVDPILAKHTPFGRVPVLQHGAFTLTETAAIVEYLNDLSVAPIVPPETSQGNARMRQVIGITDAYGYQPLVREVFSHGFYRLQLDESFDPGKVVMGLKRARPVLEMLDWIALEGQQLDGTHISLADIHLSPMIDYFTKAPEAATLLADYPALSKWWELLQDRPSLVKTDPFSIG